MAKLSPQMQKINALQEVINKNTENDFDYYVKLPLTGYEAHVRGLLIKEEDLIKSNSTTPKYTYETICQMIYNCTQFVVNEPEMIDVKDADGKVVQQTQVVSPLSTYNGFMRNIPPADRDALLWGIIVKTYDEEHTVSMVCDNCKQRFDAKFNIPQLMDVKMYQGEEAIMNKEVVLEIPEYKWTIHMKQPSIKDELDILSYNATNSKLTAATEYNMITKLETRITKVLENGASKDNELYVVSTPLEIYSMICEKPAKLRKKIFDCWNKNFGDCGVTVMFECQCPSCRNTIKQRVVPMAHLFQMVG